jgi:hypothetical protein
MSDSIQQGSGAVACVTWLAAGTYFALSSEGVPFVSWGVFWYLLTGIFLAPFVFGLPVYALQQRLPAVLGRSRDTMIFPATFALYLAESILVVIAARWVFVSYILSRMPPPA